MLSAVLSLVLNVTVASPASPETHKMYGIRGAKLIPRSPVSGSNSYKVRGSTYTVMTTAKAKEYSKVGIASFYHDKFHGRKTSNGEIYSQQGFTAAHKTLPINSYVLVTNLRNNRKVIVRINDRGPFVNNRIIDLSHASARELGMTAAGVKNVKLEVLHVDRNGNVSGAGAASLAKLAKDNQTRQNIQTARNSRESAVKNSQKSTALRMANIHSEQEAEDIIEQLAMKNIATEIKKSGDKYEVWFTRLDGIQDVNRIKRELSQMGKPIYVYNQ